MKIKNVELKNGAVFIADVHYKKGNKEFLDVLQSFINNPPPQIFFLGDIFHLLLPFNFLIKENIDAINLINQLASKTEVYYTPGNHDFNIEKIFINVVISDAFVDEKKSIFLTHGDLTDKDIFYKLYVLIIRTYLGNQLLNILSLNFINNWLFKKILQKKIKCTKISNFSLKVKSKIADISYKNLIEGHYHQNIFLDFGDKAYFNLGAYVCDKSYFIYEDLAIKEKNGNRRQNIKGWLKRT